MAGMGRDMTKYIQAGAMGAVKVGAGIVAQKAGGELVRSLGGTAVANFEGSQPDIAPVIVNVGGGAVVVLGGAALAKATGIGKRAFSPGNVALAMTGVVAGALLESSRVQALMDQAAGAITGLIPGGLSTGVAMGFQRPGAANLGSYGAPAMTVPGGMSTEVAMGYPAGAKLL